MYKGSIISLQDHRKNNRYAQRTISEQNEENIKEWIKIHFNGAATKQITVFKILFKIYYFCDVTPWAASSQGP